MDEEPSLYERVWRESPPGDLTDESAGSPPRSRLRRKGSYPPPGAQPPVRDDDQAGAAFEEADLERWAEDLVKRAVAEVEGVLQKAITHLAGPPPEDQETFLRRMIDVIDERLASGPVEDLSTRMNELEETLADSWRRSLAQYNEDKLGFVDVIESKLQSLLGQLEDHAVHSGSMQHRIDNDVVGGFAKLAAQLTNQVSTLEVDIEHGLGEQQKALAALLKSIDSVAGSLERIVGSLGSSRDGQSRNFPWGENPA